MKRKSLALALALLIPGLTLAGAAHADPDFKLSGFGTLGFTHSDNREADFAGSLYAPNGAGKTHGTALSGETRAGVQGSTDFGNGLTAVVQVVSDIRADNTYRPKFEWANLKYQITDSSHVRAGRVVAPMFVNSEYRNVGYALTQVRTSWEVYSQNPLTTVDGINAGSKINIGDGILSLDVTGGRLKDTIPGATASGSGALGSASYEIGSSTFILGYSEFKLSIGIDPIKQYQAMVAMPTLNPLTGQPTTLGSIVGYPVPNIRSDVRGHVIDLGYTYDSGTWIVQGEYVRRAASGPIVPLASTWSLMAGYRIDKFTPYASYSKLTTKLQTLGYGPAQVPAQLAGAFAACQQGFLPAATCMGDGTPINPGVISQYTQLATVAGTINTVDAMMQARKYDQSTLSLGVRYDFYKSLALKAQYDRISKPGGSGGQFVSPAVGNYPASWVNNSQTVNLFTVSLDFVF